MITKSRKRAKSRMGHGLVGESGSGMKRKHFRTNDVFTLLTLTYLRLPTIPARRLICYLGGPRSLAK